MDYENEMRGVLRAALDGAPFGELTENQQYMLKECCDAGYIDGVICLQMASGRIVAEYVHTPRLTHAGAVFLETNALKPEDEPPHNERSDGAAKHARKKHCKDILASLPPGIRNAILIIITGIVSTVVGGVILHFLHL